MFALGLASAEAGLCRGSAGLLCAPLLPAENPQALAPRAAPAVLTANASRRAGWLNEAPGDS